MRPIAVEMLTVIEQNNQEYVSLLNQQFFDDAGIADPVPVLHSTFTIASEKLSREIVRATDEEPHRKIEQTNHRSFKTSVCSMSFLLDEETNELMLLSYFGLKTPASRDYVDGLIHLLEVVSWLQNNTGPQPSDGSLRFEKRSKS